MKATKGEEELRARRSLVVLCDLHRRKGFAEKLFSRFHLMNEDLLQDLVLYKKSHEKAVSIAACSLITLLREICPSFLVKKDRVDNDIYARVAYEEDDNSVENDGECDNEFFPGSGQSSGIDGLEDDACRNDSDEEGSDDRELANVCDTEELNEEIEVQAIPIDGQDEDADDGKDSSNGKKRKLGDFVKCLNDVDARPHSLKRLVIKAAKVSTDEVDGILSNEDFQHIKELKAHIRSKLSKQERVALIRAGRGDREKYKAKIVVKQKRFGQHQPARLPLNLIIAIHSLCQILFVLSDEVYHSISSV
ncbi:hypothetical protein HPP92_026926 [Vanilla planifolia]|uniref:Protein SDA1 n=1 Tax=Vanilla planifolia TaxID=51239 RepID=A0A835PGV0_VANPL|nr:hypothetical protein HPP92_026926 [Vanilla planifolia]